MTEAVITRSTDAPAASTVEGHLTYTLVDSERPVASAFVPIAPPASDEAVRALRERLRNERGGA